MSKINSILKENFIPFQISDYFWGKFDSMQICPISDSFLLDNSIIALNFEELYSNRTFKTLINFLPESFL